ncbi:MAG: hypothetical protein K2P70_09365 [Hyphomonadaceae bacterium]|nr:hypothetical protein [Hyphomonadaceae bacterium]
MRFLIALSALTLVAACDVPDIEQIQQEATEIGGQAIEAARGAVDTRTACMLAGQSEAFCGCVQERLGPEITQEHLDAITGIAQRTVEGGSLETAAEEAQNVDPATREALVQCATQAAVQGIVGEAGN